MDKVDNPAEFGQAGNAEKVVDAAIFGVKGTRGQIFEVDSGILIYEVI